jgi:hypothetical protein
MYCNYQKNIHKARRQGGFQKGVRTVWEDNMCRQAPLWVLHGVTPCYSRTSVLLIWMHPG